MLAILELGNIATEAGLLQETVDSIVAKEIVNVTFDFLGRKILG